MSVPCFYLYIALCPFKFCNHLDGEVRADCLNLFILLCLRIVMLLFLTVYLVGLQCVVLVFRDHTLLPFICSRPTLVGDIVLTLLW